MVENQRASVWHIEDNDLKHCNKIISKVNYKGFEVAVLKQDLDLEYQEFIFKDKNNEYWKLGNAPIKFENFVLASQDKLSNKTEYCDSLKGLLQEYKLRNFFEKKIENGRYFNRCELEYIYRYIPEIYEQAKESRERIIEKNHKREEVRKQENAQWEKEQVEKINSAFDKKLKEIKYKIFIGETVKIETLEYCKNNDYFNGRKVQNCILYLAKQYDIKIPLATQGFINNRLLRYNFRTGQFAYNAEKNSRPSQKMHEYLEQIFEKVKEEYQKELDTKKSKTAEAR